MKLQNLSVKRLFGRVAMGLVLSMSGITIALFLVTKQTAVLLTGGALLLCALVGIFVLTKSAIYFPLCHGRIPQNGIPYPIVIRIIIIHHFTIYCNNFFMIFFYTM